jgi:hypothetical protein
VRIQHDVEQVIGVKPEFHGPGVLDAADEEPGDDQQHQRSGHLRGDQKIADAMASGARGIAAPAFLQHAV